MLFMNNVTSAASIGVRFNELQSGKVHRILMLTIILIIGILGAIISDEAIQYGQGSLF